MPQLERALARPSARGVAAGGLRSRRSFLTAFATLAAAACDPRGLARRAGGKRRLSIATGNVGGVYYPYGGGLAKVLSESLVDVDATAEATGGSVDNLKLVGTGRADVGFTLADTLDDAIQGRGAFHETGPLPLRALAMLYSNYTHVVAFAGSGLAHLVDLRGKVVSTGAPGSGTEVIALRVLAAAGIDPAGGLTRQTLGVGPSADALRDGKLDAFFWSGGVPTGAILDLAATPGRNIALLPNDEVLPALQKQFGPELYVRISIASHAYPGLGVAVPVVGVANALVVSEQMDARLAHALTRALFEGQSELAAIHPEARQLSLATAVVGSPAPFHPGAVRFYRERDAWKR